MWENYNTVIALQNKQHARCVKRRDTFKTCIETVSTGEESDQLFLGAVDSSGNCKVWKIILFLNDVLIQFKTDTGAEVSVIPEALSQPFLSILKPSTRNLKGPSKQELQVCGKFTCSMCLDKTRSLCCQTIRLSPCWTPCN